VECPAGSGDSAVTTPSRDDIQRALEEVLDPCSIGYGSPVDICSLGLVEDVVIDGGQIRVELVLTDVTCAHYAGMRRHIADALSLVKGVEGVRVEMVTTTVWTPDRARGAGGRQALSLTPVTRSAAAEDLRPRASRITN